MHLSRSMSALILLTSLLLAESAFASPPRYDSKFWQHWGDGKAEISSYNLSYPRYGEVRQGTAVAIFVTETFSDRLRVKADPGQHPESDTFPVIKLNLTKDFPTGIYDYNIMTSAFVALSPRNSRPSGSLTKVSFSSQEWCGHVYSQALFDREQVRFTSHSYFDGEADEERSLSLNNQALSEDALILWARGLAGPRLEAGEKLETSILRSLETVRLKHRPLKQLKATLSRKNKATVIVTAIGEKSAEVLQVKLSDGTNWTFFIEEEAPHRLLKWKNSYGLEASILASKRVPYWQMNANRFQKELNKIGLKPRPARTP